MKTPTDAAKLVEHATNEVNELAFIMGYTSSEAEAIKTIMAEQAGSIENMAVTDFVDMCTTLARV